jgi:hypothetical protein
MENLEALARKFGMLCTNIELNVDDFESMWNCQEFLMELKCEEDQKLEFTPLLFAYCKSHLELQDFYKKFREHNKSNNYDDNDCYGFDEMEAHQFWESSLKANIRRAKRALDDYWTEYILHLPIVREDSEDHDSSDCDS